MDKIKLPSMVEYVKLQEKKWNYETIGLEVSFRKYKDTVLDTLNFANFLSRQPLLSDFVPAVEENGKWKILSEPKEEHGFDQHGEPIFYGVDKRKLEQYQTALDNVIFEGFKVTPIDDYEIKLFSKSCVFGYDLRLNLLYFWSDNKNYNSIDDLTKQDLTLNPKFAKELGLI